MKRITVIFLIVSFFASTTGAMAADDAMERTLRDSLYGGLIGALLGTAIVFLTDDPGDNLEYVPTGAAIGILAGAAYGIGRSTVRMSSAAEIDRDGTVTFGFPAISSEKVYDEKLGEVETIEKIELVRLRF